MPCLYNHSQCWGGAQLDLHDGFSIVLPVHNEAAMLRSVVSDCLAWQWRGTGAAEILIVENGSKDGSAALADELASKEPRLRVLHMPRADYGAALRRGIVEARGSFIAHFSVDFMDWSFLAEALSLLASGGADLVVGSKYIKSSRDGRSPLRRLPGFLFSRFTSLLLRCTVSDTHGIKAMRAACCQPLAAACRLEGALFDHEFVLAAIDEGLRIVEVPVTLRELRPSRRPLPLVMAEATGDLLKLAWQRRGRARLSRRG